ncbi:MAG: hypothetical protein JJU33_07065 [Phycisphaerales bacterium]|nr:hypothetical protein [Phycisphaerales bacterium]
MQQPEIKTTLWGGRRLVDLRSDAIDACLRFAKENGLDGVIASPYEGFASEDLAFLHDHPWIRAVVLYDVDGVDVSAISDLPQLRLLSACRFADQIDFARLQGLEHLTLHWQGSVDAEALPASLQTLRIRKYSAASEDLTGLGHLGNLRHLELVQAGFRSLEGIQAFERLEYFGCSHSRTLKDIAAIGSASLASLVFVDFECCSRIADYRPLADLPSLTELAINQCAPIDSIEFVTRCKRLEKLRFMRTDVTDGDLSPLFALKGLTNLAFTNKRRFSHRRSDFDAIDNRDQQQQK